MNNDILTIKKIHGDPLYFNFIDIGDKDYINASINETISVDDNNFATFKVHFLRQLKTRGNLDDSVLEVGEPVQIHYYYK